MSFAHTFAFTFGGDVGESNTYASQLLKLLPPGLLWNVESDSKLRATMLGVGDEFTRVQLRGVNLIDESDPRTASETLEDWERMLGLPDEQVPVIPATFAERRIAITAKLVSRGGQNYAFFETLCAAAGYPLLSIDKFVGSVLRAGFRVGDRVYGDAYAYAIRITVGPATTGALTHAQFEAVIQHATHSHIVVIFVYT